MERKILLKNNERLEDLLCNNQYIIQSKDEYLFTSDAVALANFVHVSNFGRVVDLCSGSGVVGILVNAKNKVQDVTMVEIQESLADMSRRSVKYNGLQNFTVLNKPLQNISDEIGKGIYDVVTCNPPYFEKSEDKKVNEKENIAIARHEIKVSLEEMICEASKLLKFGGDFYMVHQESSLVEIFLKLKKYNLEPKVLKVLTENKKGNIVLIKSRKGGKGGLKISLE